MLEDGGRNQQELLRHATIKLFSPYPCLQNVSRGNDYKHMNTLIINASSRFHLELLSEVVRRGDGSVATLMHSLPISVQSTVMFHMLKECPAPVNIRSPSRLFHRPDSNLKKFYLNGMKENPLSNVHSEPGPPGVATHCMSDMEVQQG